MPTYTYTHISSRKQLNYHFEKYYEVQYCSNIDTFVAPINQSLTGPIVARLEEQ